MDAMVEFLRSKASCDVVITSVVASQGSNTQAIEVSIPTLRRAMGCNELSRIFEVKATAAVPKEYLYLTLACQGYQLTDEKLGDKDGNMMPKLWDWLCTIRAVSTGQVRGTLSWCINSRSLSGYFSTNGGPSTEVAEYDYDTYGIFVEPLIDVPFRDTGTGSVMERENQTMNTVSIDNNVVAMLLSTATDRHCPPAVPFPQDDASSERV